MNKLEHKAYKAVENYNRNCEPQLSYVEQFLMRKAYVLGYNKAKREYCLTFDDVRWLLDQTKCMPGYWIETNPDCAKVLEKFKKRKKEQNG